MQYLRKRKVNPGDRKLIPLIEMGIACEYLIQSAIQLPSNGVAIQSHDWIKFIESLDRIKKTNFE